MAATRVNVTDFDPFDEQPVVSGIAGATDNANGNIFENLPGTRVYLYNGTGGAITATLVANAATVSPKNGVFGEVPNPNEAHSIAAGAIHEIAVPSARFNDANNDATMTFSGAGLTIAVLREVA